MGATLLSVSNSSQLVASNAGCDGDNGGGRGTGALGGSDGGGNGDDGEAGTVVGGFVTGDGTDGSGGGEG